MTNQGGSIQSKVVAHLRTLPIETELATAALAEAIGHSEITCLDFYLSPALEDKSVELRSAGGLKFWSLSSAAWWEHSSDTEQSAPAPFAKRKPLTRVRIDPLDNVLGNAIAGRPAGPEVIKLKPPAPPAPPARPTKAKPKAKPAQKTTAPRRTKPAASVSPELKSALGALLQPDPVHQGPARPRKSVAVKNLQQRDDFPGMELGTEDCPHNVVRHNTRYSAFFATVQIDGPPIKCKTDDLERVRIALRAYLKRTQKPGTYQVRSIRDFAADNTSRLWIQSKEIAK